MSARNIGRVLVANRGEIAIRVIRTCRELGIETVAIYSDIDRVAAHVLAADYAFPLGGTSAAESYLVIDKVIEIAKHCKADAVHPGYGFLSENDDFATALAAANIILIGPSAQSMREMGDKTRARTAVIAAGVPVVPGAAGPEGKGFPDAASAGLAAAKIGFPILLKAAAGGGGKGMRLVSEPSELTSAFEAARREALSSFGDGTIYLERAIIKPRHVEIQIFADAHGHVVHLGERDCSVQRRHQKVVEEAPSPALDSSLRQAMGEAAILAARATDYLGAGTVEFLLDPSGQFFFLEMNTRLQVEHPVTEQIHAIDLVAWQIAVAEGKPLPLSQEEIDKRRRGAAIECRVYAEDPVTFLPSPGTISALREPGGPFVRNDSGVYAGAEISPYYDPLISKLVTWGDNREQALARMRRALAEYSISGIRTNLDFHRRLLANKDFCQGDYNTGFIEYHAESLSKSASLSSETQVSTIAVAAISGQTSSNKTSKKTNRQSSSAKTNSPSSTTRWQGDGTWRWSFL